MVKQPFVLDEWIDEDETIEEINRSIGSADFSDIDPVYDLALVADEVSKRHGAQYAPHKERYCQGIEFHRPELRKWLKRHEPYTGGTRGPKHIYDWVSADAQMAAFVAAEGSLPATKSAMIYHLQEWFKETIGKEVDRGTIRPYVDRFYAAYHDETGGP